MKPKQLIRSSIREEILDRILKNELKPNDRIVESRFASELGVSRSPLREALLQLEREGFVRADPFKGFSIQGLSMKEVTEVYPIIMSLESLALMKMGPIDSETYERLININENMRANRNDPEICRELDNEWHCTLLAGYENERLHSMIEDLKKVAYRYEYLYMHEAHLIDISVRYHEEIAEAVFNQNWDKASEQLQIHWQSGMDVLLLHLRKSQE